jgi:diguanylate cyclase (GGDEF)-like protein
MVAPIGAIVAVAIVCVVIAALGSAHRANEVALESERQLFTKALVDHGERVLRQVDAITSSERVKTHISDDPEWVQKRLDAWLGTYFDQDFVFVVDSSGRLIYQRSADRPPLDPDWFRSAQVTLAPVIDFMRGRAGGTLIGPSPIEPSADLPIVPGRKRLALVRLFAERPAFIVAATAATHESMPGVPSDSLPFVIAVQFIDKEVLADIGARLNLRNLRQADGTPPPDDYLFQLDDDLGQPVAAFAWTPAKPGAEIVYSVVPFIGIALAGFIVLAGLVMRYMRRTTAAITAGENRLRHLALHDPLCGLPNRIFFGERLEAILADVRRGGPTAAVFYIDLDHFKDVNDTLGHPVGDELIRNVTLRLSRTLRGDDLVARLGGDEFAVITTTEPDSPSLHTIAARLLSALCTPYLVNDQNIVIGASIGIAVIDGRAAAAADIMRYADMALYRAKNEGRNRACIYDEVMDADLSHRKLLESDLRQALENDKLQVVYQPVVNNSGEKTIGVEALARWTHPERGVIPPSDFIPIAEHSGLIIELGQWVLRRACLDGKAWPGMTVAVNVSPLQFRQPDFVEVVERILSETEFDPARLELEVTESTLIGNVDSAEAAMLRLKALGLRLALDDFGTGYSSLLYLRRFPFDKLKIDRSFVLSIEKAADAAAIVHAVVSLGRGLGMKVTAEGVETAEQHLFLRAAGIHSMQGFRFGVPMKAADITNRLGNPQSAPSLSAIAG